MNITNFSSIGVIVILYISKLIFGFCSFTTFIDLFLVCLCFINLPNILRLNAGENSLLIVKTKMEEDLYVENPLRSPSSYCKTNISTFK